MKTFFKYLGLAVLAVFVVLVGLRLFVLDLANVQGSDMFPTLGRDAWVIVHRHKEPRRGDLVMFRPTEGSPWLVRRVIALPGDRIAMENARPVIPGHPAFHEDVGNVTIDRREFRVIRETLDGRSWEILDDTVRTMADMQEIEIRDGYFVLADHREHAKDSREYKTIPRSQVRGVVWRILHRGRYP